jgi:two-component system, OmpR family, response regulator
MQDGKYVILCIDDDPDVLMSLQIILEASGYVVKKAPDARAGLQAFKDLTPDAVIIDLIMEEVDAGLDLVKELRALNSKVPLYMLSSTGDYLYTTLDANALGLAGVFQKPIKPQVLLKLLETKLKGRKPRP